MAVPKLRFKADDGSDYPDLEETKLDTLMAFKNGINASGDKFGRGTKCISVMDILNNSCITYDVIKGEVDVDEKTLQNFTVEYGDAEVRKMYKMQDVPMFIWIKIDLLHLVGL